MATPTVTLDSDEVVLGKADGPGIYIAPAGSSPPTDLDSVTSPWKLLGYLNEDGPKIGQDVDNGTVMPWQGTAPVKQFVISRTVTIEVTMIQLNADTLSMYFGQPTPTSTATGFEIDLDPNAQPDEYAVLLVTKDGRTTVGYFLAKCTVSDVDDLEMPKDDAQGLPVTLGAMVEAGSLGKVIVKKAAKAGAH